MRDEQKQRRDNDDPGNAGDRLRAQVWISGGTE